MNSRVEQIDAEGVVVNGERIAAATVLWAAGVTASPAAAWLGQEPDKAGRLRVGPDLSLPGMPDVFAIGDTALTCLGWRAGAGARTRGETGWRLRRFGASRAVSRRADAVAVSLPPSGQLGHHRAQERSRRIRPSEAYGRSRLVAVGRRAHTVPSWNAQSLVGHARLGLVVLYV